MVSANQTNSYRKIDVSRECFNLELRDKSDFGFVDEVIADDGNRHLYDSEEDLPSVGTNDEEVDVNVDREQVTMTDCEAYFFCSYRQESFSIYIYMDLGPSTSFVD